MFKAKTISDGFFQIFFFTFPLEKAEKNPEKTLLFHPRTSSPGGGGVWFFFVFFLVKFFVSFFLCKMDL